jgi:hypothetical protein
LFLWVQYLGREVSERALKTRAKKQFRDDRKHYAALKEEEKASRIEEKVGADALRHDHMDEEGASEVHGLRERWVGSVEEGDAHAAAGRQEGVLGGAEEVSGGGAPNDPPRARDEGEGGDRIERIDRGGRGVEEEEEDDDDEDGIVDQAEDERAVGARDDDAQQAERFMPYVVFLRSRYRENPSSRDVILRKICYFSLIVDLTVASIGIFGAASSTWIISLCILSLIGDGCGIYGVRMSSNKMLTACLVSLMTVVLAISVQKVMLFDLLRAAIALLTVGCTYILRSRLMAQVFITTYQGDQPPN